MIESHAITCATQTQ